MLKHFIKWQTQVTIGKQLFLFALANHQTFLNLDVHQKVLSTIFHNPFYIFHNPFYLSHFP